MLVYLWKLNLLNMQNKHSSKQFKKLCIWNKYKKKSTNTLALDIKCIIYHLKILYLIKKCIKYALISRLTRFEKLIPYSSCAVIYKRMSNSLLPLLAFDLPLEPLPLHMQFILSWFLEYMRGIRDFAKFVNSIHV